MKPAIDSHMLLAADALEKIPVTDRITTTVVTLLLRLFKSEIGDQFLPYSDVSWE